MASSDKSSKGFTILEMLVVIAMSGMIVMILLQALQHTMSLHQRFGTELDRNSNQAMAQSWLTQLLEGLQPDDEDGKQQFKGQPLQISAISTSVFTGQFGVPTAFQLRLRFDAAEKRMVLEYSDAQYQEKPLRLLSWEGRRGRFVYLDTKQQEHESWPPEFDRSRQIPESIRIETERDGQPWMLAFKPAGPVNPLPDIRKKFNEVMR